RGSRRLGYHGGRCVALPGCRGAMCEDPNDDERERGEQDERLPHRAGPPGQRVERRLLRTSNDVPGERSELQFRNIPNYNELRDAMSSRSATVKRHVRPTVAKWWFGPSISRRISLFVALIVVGVVKSVAYL